ncbi:hypothetical protein [Dankookia sp. P2]
MRSGGADSADYAGASIAAATTGALAKDAMARGPGGEALARRAAKQR